MKKHISEVELCDDTKSIHRHCSTCENYHKDDFCLLCDYELEGDRLYMEIHGPNGWDAKTIQIDSAQPYVCMECAGQFKAHPCRNFHIRPVKLLDFCKEGKK